MHTVLIGLLFLISFSHCSILELRKMDPSTNAACLDGTPPGYYFQQGSGDGVNQYLIYFMGGGLCQGETRTDTLNDCLARSSTALGSSLYMSPLLPGLGIFDGDPANNPDYYNWNRIVIWYCDGALHQGYLTSPLLAGGKLLFFRGDLNTRVMFDHIIQNTDIIRASDVMLTGGSAGGVATFLWADYLKGILPQNIKYGAVPDSGFIYDWAYDGKKNSYFKLRNQIISLMSIVNIERPLPVNSDCISTYVLEPWKCLYPEYLTDFIKTDLFIAHFQYDAWFISNELGENCIDSQTLSMKKCILGHQTNINNFRDKVVARVRELMATKPSWGAWMPACVGHVASVQGIYNNIRYEIPMNSGNQLTIAISRWFKGLGTENPQKQSYIDDAQWPSNTPCSSVTLGAVDVFQN